MSRTAKKSRVRFTLLILGACFAATLLLALTSWQSLLVRYYVYKLNNEPEFAWAITGNGEKHIHPAQDEALRHFLAESKGQTWFLRQLWTHVIEPPLQQSQKAGRTIEVGVVFDQGTGKAMSLWRLDEGTLSASVSPPDYEKSRQCSLLAARTKCHRVPVPGKPGWSVTVKEPNAAEFESLQLEAAFTVLPEPLGRYYIVETAEEAGAGE